MSSTARQLRSATFLAARAADPTALLPIPRETLHKVRRTLWLALRARGLTAPPLWKGAPKAWQSEAWPLTRAYVQAEIFRSHRTVERCANLAYLAAQRLGTAITE